MTDWTKKEQDRQQKTLLVVDDEYEQLSEQKKRLEAAGYKVIPCVIRREKDETVPASVQQLNGHALSIRTALEDLLADKDAFGSIDAVVSDGSMISARYTDPFKGNDVARIVQQTDNTRFVPTLIRTGAIDELSGGRGEEERVKWREDYKRTYPNAVAIFGKSKACDAAFFECLETVLKSQLGGPGG